MNQELTELFNKYKERKLKEPNKYLFDDRVILKSDDIELEGYIITIDYVKAYNENFIFISIANDNELLFSDLYLKSKDEIFDEYDQLSELIFNNSFDEIIKKIHKKFF